MIYSIAAGLYEKAGSSEKYPYSNHLIYGINMFSALAVRKGMRSVLSDMHEAAFIERYAAIPVRDWFKGWDSRFTEQVGGFRLFKLGALVILEKDLSFSLTDECLDLYDSTENDMFKALEERQIYQKMRGSSQEEYTAVRRFFIEHPVCSEKELRGFKLKYNAPEIWEILSLAYEAIPKDSYRCPSCGWTMRFRGLSAVCCNRSCSDTLPDRAQLEPLNIGEYQYRLRHGVMRYISLPGRLELEIQKKAERSGCKTVLWYDMDKYDVRVTLPSGKVWAIDAKTHRNPYILANEIKSDGELPTAEADRKFYVIPDELLSEHGDYCDICNSALKWNDAECITDKRLYQLLRREVGANEEN